MTPQWLITAMNQTCTIWDRVPTGEDEYGNEVYETVPLDTSKCLLQPVSQADIQLGRAGVGTYTLFLPGELAGTLSPFATYEVDGVRYEADGPAADYRMLFSAGVHHVEVNVSLSTA